ncbi:response regulator transcription factor [Microbacterium pseudoresistens]|uniref:DNA-binding response OmpR family regulator n=1 Tax=Microbacterium pseudoresistens TaxID=640634 RepID=A0A7Y9EWE1_9MICO|nr:response regulator transcription factor [Microbacterium pseudoresistens]NYD54305.1 DNA-binding response OmpR family regulator [Microbacterium pseudoresistens]
MHEEGTGDRRARIVVVEDDQTVRDAVTAYLRANGYDVTAVDNGVGGLRAIREEKPDVAVVDRMLPGLSGDEICREVRTFSAVPILVLTALGEVEQRIEGLEAGADDYLVKPFALRELLLRIAGLLRRARAADAPTRVVTRDEVTIDPARRRVWIRDKEVALAAREYELLAYLFEHDGRAVSRDDILRDVWGWSFGEASTVTVHVRRLREKLEDDPRQPRYVLTEWGVGYRLSTTGAGS